MYMCPIYRRESDCDVLWPVCRVCVRVSLVSKFSRAPKVNQSQPQPTQPTKLASAI